MNEELKKMLIERSEELHNSAMAAAQDAFANRKKDFYKTTFTEYAFAKEKDAALLISCIPDFEPKRSILFKSAACLAIDLERFEEARTLLRIGLDGAKGMLADELRELEEQIDGK